MIKLILIRHGQASFGQPNYDQLSEIGIEQSVLLGKHFQSINTQPSRIFIGSMQRHKQTAENVLEQLPSDKPTLTTMDHWNEFDHQAIFKAYNATLQKPFSLTTNERAEPLQKKDFKPFLIAALKHWIQAGETSSVQSSIYPESWHQFRERIRQGFEEITAQSADGDTVLVFTSGGPISVLLSSILGLDDEACFNINMQLVNTGCTKLFVNKRVPQLSTFNEHSYFEQPEHQHLLTYI